MEPTVAPTAEITLFGETHVLKYGFRAYQELGINPFNKESIEAYNAQPKDCKALAQTVRAGILHEYYGRKAPRKDEECPSLEDVMDDLDPISYVQIWLKALKVMGVDKDEEPEKKPADPPQA